MINSIKKIFKIIGVTTTLVAASWGVYTHCDSVQDPIESAYEVISPFSSENIKFQAIQQKLLIDLAKEKLDQAYDDLVKINKVVSINETKNFSENLLSRFCYAAEIATDSNRCNPFAKTFESLNLVDDKKWIESLEKAKISPTQENTKIDANTFLNLVERVRKFESAWCHAIDHRAIVNTLRYMDLQYQKNDDFFQEVLKELKRLNLTLTKCADSLEIDISIPTHEAKKILEIKTADFDQKKSEFDEAKKKENDIHYPASKLTFDDTSKIRKGSGACLKMYGVCSFIMNLENHCMKLKTWLLENKTIKF